VQGIDLPKKKVYLVYAAMMMATALSALDGTIINTAMTTIVGDLGGLRAYTWVGTAYLLTSTVVTPLFGKFSDLFGRRNFTQIAIGTFVVGSLICAIANSMTVLVIGRGVQGIGGGGIMAMSVVVIADIISPRERGRYVGAFMSVYAIASVAGPLLGGFFVDQLNWRWIFLINIPLGIVASAMVHSSLRIPFIKRDTQIDFIGAFLLVGSITSLVLMISWISGEWGWSSAPTVATGALTVSLFAGFIWWEPHAADPILPLHLFKNRIVQMVIPMVAIVGALITAAGAFMPLFLQAVSGVSPMNSGLLMVPMMAGITVTSIWVGRRIAHTGRYKIWPVLGMICGVFGMVLMTFINDTPLAISAAVIGMVFVGFATGATMPTGTLIVQNSVDIRDLGIASSVTVLCRSLGQTIALAAFGAIFNANVLGKIDDEYLRTPRTIKQLPEPARSDAIDVITDGVSAVFMWAVPLAVIALICTLFIVEIPLRKNTALQEQHEAVL
jgi:EmrB/QacA subfamily drug resistance transporter